MNTIDLISLLLMLVIFILGSLIPIVFYNAPFYIRFSLSKRMVIVNFYTAFWICLATMLIGNNIHKINHINNISGVVAWIVALGAISVVYYDYFYKEAHYKCPQCGSRKTVKLDDSDGEYFDMDFHCKHCNKDFTIDKSSIGGWPD